MTKWMRNEARAQSPTKTLQKARGPKPSNGISYRNWLAPEYPARHRKSNRRVAQVHHPHTLTPKWIGWYLLGEEFISTYRHNSSGLQGRQGTTVPSVWPGSNR